MPLDPADLKTETFTNSQGWTLVRVTHLPTGISAERERTRDRVSPVGAQSECVTELKERLDAGLLSAQEDDAPSAGEAPVNRPVPVTRAEFEALESRVRELERRLR